jgi:hypothetical protein
MGFRYRGKLSLYVVGIFLSPALLISQPVNADQLRSQLKQQGFTGVIDGDIKLADLGNIKCGKESLQVIYYEWTEGHSLGLAIHQSKRILFMSDRKYLGSYPIDDAPMKVSGTAVLFNYSTDRGHIITCSGDRLPKIALLDGEEERLEK